MRNLPFVEIVHTTNISISSFCFDESDSASPYVTVARLFFVELLVGRIFDLRFGKEPIEAPQKTCKKRP